MERNTGFSLKWWIIIAIGMVLFSINIAILINIDISSKKSIFEQIREVVSQKNKKTHTENTNTTNQVYEKPAGNATWGNFFNNFFEKDHFNKSYAVVIGIGDYNSDWLDLSASPVDVQRVSDYLINEAGFDYVAKLVDKNATKQQIEKLMIEDFPDKVGEKDRFLFYFSGHGTQRKIGHSSPQGYLVLQSSKATAYADMISMKDIKSWDSLLVSKQTLFILDACFSGAAGTQIKSPLIDKKLDRLSQDGHHLITAGTANEESIASIEKWNGSLFTYAFLRGVRGNADSTTIDHPADGIISLKELMKYIEDTIDKELVSLQYKISPQMFELKDSQGEFFFISKKYEDDSTEINDPDATNPEKYIVVSKGNDIYYIVTLIIPSKMVGADIIVDGKPAHILKQSLAIVKIRVKKKDTNHQITVQKDEASCSKNLFISQDINDLTPCNEL